MVRLVRYIIEKLFLNGILFFFGRMPTCKTCRVKLKEEQELLFLIPVWVDHEYKPSVEYYCQNSRLIASVEEIPTGQRACRTFLLACPRCRAKKVSIVDFLRVRDSELIKEANEYDIAAFDLYAGTLLAQSLNAASHQDRC